MKIWIDFINTPQVSFFLPFIKEFKTRDYELVLTCRDSGNTVAMLKNNNLPFTIIGDKVGRSTVEKTLFFPLRIYGLLGFIRKSKPDIAISQSSFYQPIVARLLKIPCLFTNDNEHARGNLIGFLFASRVLLPLVLQDLSLANKWPLKDKVNFYPSVKESIYLSQQPNLIKRRSEPKKIIYFRPEPRSAQYYKGPINFFDDTLLKLAESNQVLVLPRDKEQANHYHDLKFKNVIVSNEIIRLEDIVSNCALFIGAGGSMSRELAVLGIPVISIYQAKLLRVDQCLVDAGLMVVDPAISFEKIKMKLDAQQGKTFETDQLSKGEASYHLMLKEIINLKYA